MLCNVTARRHPTSSGQRLQPHCLMSIISLGYGKHPAQENTSHYLAGLVLVSANRCRSRFITVFNSHLMTLARKHSAGLKCRRSLKEYDIPRAKVKRVWRRKTSPLLPSNCLDDIVAFRQNHRGSRSGRAVAHLAQAHRRKSARKAI